MFLPYGDDNADRRCTPVVVYSLLVINAVVWFLELVFQERFWMAGAVVPFELTHGVDLTGKVQLQAGDQTLELVHYPALISPYASVVTSMFLHGSWMHIIGNMLFLWIFGDQIEDRLGKVRFVVFYLACGIVACAAHVLWNREAKIPMLGASGAISGVLAAYLILFPRNKVKVIVYYMMHEWPAAVVLGVWFLMQFLGQFATAGNGVAYMAHMGGFACGAALLGVGWIWSSIFARAPESRLRAVRGGR